MCRGCQLIRKQLENWKNLLIFIIRIEWPLINSHPIFHFDKVSWKFSGFRETVLQSEAVCLLKSGTLCRLRLLFSHCFQSTMTQVQLIWRSHQEIVYNPDCNTVSLLLWLDALRSIWISFRFVVTSRNVTGILGNYKERGVFDVCLMIQTNHNVIDGFAKSIGMCQYWIKNRLERLEPMVAQSTTLRLTDSFALE